MTPGWFRDPLTPYGERVARRKLGLPPDAPEAVFQMVVRGYQELKGLLVTGRLDEPTAAALGEAAEWGSGPPEWWFEGMAVQDVAAPADVVHRLQGRLGLKPTDVIDEVTAWHLEVDGLVE
jgi:hypothetical protein